MLDRPANIPAETLLRSFAEARADAVHDPAMATLVGWVESYLMREHADLGRQGAVCPFTRQAAKIDAVRLAISQAGPSDEADAFSVIRRGFGDLERIACKPGMEHFRTVIVGFPNCGGPEGVDMLQRVQKAHKFYSLSRFRMIGFMHARNDAPGLWNPDFRPLRSPLPVLAIRHLVEQDAPFAARHPLLMVPYLIKFRFSGAKKLWAYARAAS